MTPSTQSNIIVNIPSIFMVDIRPVYSIPCLSALNTLFCFSLTQINPLMYGSVLRIITLPVIEFFFELRLTHSFASFIRHFLSFEWGNVVPFYSTERRRSSYSSIPSTSVGTIFSTISFIKLVTVIAITFIHWLGHNFIIEIKSSKSIKYR